MSGTTTQTKPRVRFCWWCGRKLRGSTFVEKTIEGYARTLHKACAEMPDVITRDDEMPALVRCAMRGGAR